MTDPRPGSFDPERVLRVLAEHDVRFVLIGGWAAKLQGSPTVTADVDICYDQGKDNLVRLAEAMHQFRPRLRDVDPTLPFVLDRASLAASETLNLATTAGDVDLLAAPAGIDSFDALYRNADTLELEDLRLKVASIADLIAMKRAAGRPKDRVEVEILEALADEIQREAR